MLKNHMLTGIVTNTGDNTGGLVGYQQTVINTYNHYETQYNYIQESYASGKVSSLGKNVGGLVGYQYSYNAVNAGYIQNNYDIIENSFATGDVDGTANVGALIGNAYRQCACNDANQNAYIQITNSYATRKSNKCWRTRWSIRTII